MWNRYKKILRVGDFEKRNFFESAILIFFFFLEKNIFFAFFPWKLVKVYWLARMGQNFDQVKCGNTFFPMPNILKGSVSTCNYLVTRLDKARHCFGILSIPVMKKDWQLFTFWKWKVKDSYTGTQKSALVRNTLFQCPFGFRVLIH